MTFARVRAFVVIGLLVVFAVVFVVVALVRDTQGGPPPVATCPEGWARADLALREEEEIKINVYNATDSVGLANQIADEFASRKFQVQKKGNDPKRKGVKEVAVLRFGPKAVGSAHVLQAYFLAKAVREYDPKREDDVVDVVIGDAFQQLATTTEVNQSLVDLGKPILPAQSCAIESA